MRFLLRLRGLGIVLFSLYTFGLSFSAKATPSSGVNRVESTERLSIPALKQKKFDEVENVTDAELRAKAGSRSLWSLSGYMGYSGPRIDRLHQDVRPNPDRMPQEPRTSVNGSLGVRYRWSPQTSVSADTGLRFFTPLAGARDGELSDPGLSLERLYPLFKLQMRSRYSLSVTTSEYYADQGQLGTLNMAHDFKRKIGNLDSRWLFSVGSSFNWFLFERPVRDGDARVSNYLFTIYPGFQFNIWDNLNFGTSLAFGYSNLRREENWWNWEKRLWSQRFSLGYGLTRNIFFSPYLNFFPENFTWDTTSFNMNVYLNIF